MQNRNMDIYIKQIAEEDYPAFAKISLRAYPTAYKASKTALQDIIKGLKDHESAYDMTYIGAYIDDQLVGGMRYYTFEMNFHGTMISAAGIGSVAVDLLHKKQHVAQKLIDFADQRSKDLAIPLMTLYPFRPSFYKSFGYGYGSPLHHYKLAPANFHDFKVHEGLSYLDEVDFAPIESCYMTYVNNHHGMMHKSTNDLRRIEKLEDCHLVVYKEDGQITGYMIFKQTGITEMNFLRQTIFISEMIYNTTEALKAFSTFLHRQKDQVEYIELHTFDNRFYQLLDNVEYTPDTQVLPLISHRMHDTCLGMMYKVLDPAELIEWVEDRVNENLVFNITSPGHKAFSHESGNNQDIETFEINPGSTSPIEIDMDLAVFSSWIMGAVGLESLYFKGLVQCTQADKLAHLDRSFYLDAPECHNTF